jgi:dipeptidase E
MVTKRWIAKLGLDPRRLTLAFIDTAAEVYGDVEQPWLQADRQALVEAGFQVNNYSLTGRKIAELKKDLAAFDVLFVVGGNTFYLLEQANLSGFTELMQSDFFAKQIYVGSSAGSVICCSDIEAIKFIDDPAAAKLSSTKAIGLIEPLLLPHFDNDYFKEKYAQLMAYVSERKIAVLPMRDDEYAILIAGNFELIK